MGCVTWDLGQLALLQATLDAIPDPVFVKNREHQWIVLNDAFCQLLGCPREQLLGRSDFDFFPPDQAKIFWRIDDVVLNDGQLIDNEEFATDAAGVAHTIWTRKVPLRNTEGEIVGLCGIITDITERNRQRDQQQAIIDAQAAMLDALAMPIVEIWHGVLLLSLIGEMSSGRAARATESLLAQIVARHARVVLLDVTGMPSVDAAVAAAIQRTVNATRLLGCKTMLVGVGPAIARALTALDIDFTHVTSCASVHQGLARAIQA